LAKTYEDYALEEIALGKEAAKALNNEAVQLFFEGAQETIIDELKKTEVGEAGHITREGLVHRLSVLHSLQNFLSQAVEGGKAKEQELEASAGDD